MIQMLNLKEKTKEELFALLSELKFEIASREEKFALYEHGCSDGSNHHLKKYKHWAKLVTAVDLSKNNGYAFQGKFK